MDFELFTTGQLLQELSGRGVYVWPSTLQSWLDSGVLPHPQRVGRYRLWNADDINRVFELAKRRVKRGRKGSEDHARTKSSA